VCSHVSTIQCADFLSIGAAFDEALESAKRITVVPAHGPAIGLTQRPAQLRAVQSTIIATQRNSVHSADFSSHWSAKCWAHKSAQRYALRRTHRPAICCADHAALWSANCYAVNSTNLGS
jgi:hypothetical protein